MKKTKKLIGAVCLVIAMAMVVPSFVPSLSGTETVEAASKSRVIYNNYITSGTVTVEAASKVKLNKTKATLYTGKTLQLKVKGTKKKVTWKSSNKKVATVSKNGKVTAKKKGKATITATVSGKKYNCKVTVKEIALKSISLNKTSLTLDAGKEYKLNVKYNPSNTTVNKKVSWSSSNSSVVTVDNEGNIYASSAGKATITAKVGNKKAKCVVTVKKSIANNLTILKNYITKYGKANSDGNRYIKLSHSQDGGTFDFGIVYEKNTNKLHFISLVDSSGAKSSVSMYIGTENSGKVSPEFIIVFDYDDAYCEADASFNAAAYTQNDTVYFNVKDSNGLGVAYIQKLANSALRVAFRGWNLLLVEETGLQLSDIGFTSYK